MKWEENVRRVVPYTPGEQPKEQGVVKLNTNENPYPPSPGVLEALRTIRPQEYSLYPDPDASGLRQALADYHGVSKEQVFVGVGSDDVLSLAFLTFFNGERPVLFPDITYSFYDVWAKLYRIPYQTKPLREDFTIDPGDYRQACGGVIFPNPNAPTGVLEDLALIEEIVGAHEDAVVVVDEAYIDFGGVSALPLLSKYENLLVVRTFSKSRSMAGMRIGYAIGSRKLIGYLNDVKFSFNSYTMNLPSLRCGAASVADEAYFRETLQRIVATRENTKRRLLELGFRFPDSRSNFIFATHETVPAKTLFEALRRENIYVRYFPLPRIDNYLRISIGTDEAMRALSDCLEKCVGR